MEWILVLVCLVLTGFLAAAEIAFVSITRAQVRELVKSGRKSAKALFRLRENPERTLSVLQIGISLVGALAAAVGGAEAQETFSPFLTERFHLSIRVSHALAIAIVVIPYTLINVIFAELVPKTLALRNPGRIALLSARWLDTLDTIFLPIVDFLEWATKRILALCFPKSRANVPSTTVDTVELDTLSVQARQYVLNLVGLEKKRVRDVMMPWTQVDCAQTTDQIGVVEAMSLRSGHTRLPVVAEGRVVGIINTKELHALVKSGAQQWDQIIRPISQVQEYDPLFKALRQMQEKRSHLSAVFAGTTLTGIVTMEDILEEVIGEIYDEDDDGALRRILSTAATARRPLKL